MESVGVKPEGTGSIPVCCTTKDSTVVEQMNHNHPDAGFSRGPAVSPQGFSSELETLQDRLCAAVDTARADAGSTTRSLGFARRLRRRARHDASSNLGPPNFQEAAFAFSPSFETKPAFRPRAGKANDGGMP